MRSYDVKMWFGEHTTCVVLNYAVLRILLALAMCDNGSDSGATCSSGSASEQDSRSSQQELVEASVQAPK